MKFQANVVFELKADSITEAGERLDALLRHVEVEGDIAAKIIELRTPPADISTGPRVVLPPVATPERSPGPQLGQSEHVRALN
jgi:hypothetical protein